LQDAGIAGIVRSKMLSRSHDRRETMTEPTGAEPSLDEILASIRRIISEEGPASALPSMRRLDTVDTDEVLVLTRRVPMEANAMTALDHTSPTEADFEIISRDPAQAPVLEAAQQPTAAPAFAEADPIEKDEAVVAPQTEAQAAAAFDRLSAATHEKARDPSASLLMPAAGRTIEDVVRELMRPLIKEWLDENLPAIVQARVDQEIDRIARQRVR
jgi:cell pole-organizing protein PopZ